MAFLDGLGRYAEDRNDPNAPALSGLSPWLHFGQISAQRCALRIRQQESSSKGCRGPWPRRTYGPCRRGLY